MGPYEVLGELGRGAMGVVFRARHTGLDRVCALKVIESHFASQPGTALERFRREAQACARIGKHPNIVSCFDVGEDAGRLYFAMEIVEGRDLARMIESRGPLPEVESFEIARKVAIALDHAHRRGIVHRDVKPANVIVDRTGEPLVTDFGLALDVRAGQLTAEGDILGTPHYMAPEQARSEREKIDARTDVYSLGATLFDMLTGEPPFDGSAMTVLTAVVRDDPPPVRSLRGDLSAAAESIVAKALEKRPDDRYQTALEMADDLGRALVGEEVRAPPLGWRQALRRFARRHRGTVATGAVAMVMAIAVVTIVLVRAWQARASRDAAVRRSLEAVAADDQEKRIAVLREAIALDPTWPVIHVQLAQACYDRAVERYRAGRWDDYEADLHDAVAAVEEAERRGGIASGAHLRGTLLESLGDIPGSIAAYGRAAELDPGGAWGISGLMNAAILEERWSEARVLATREISLTSEDAQPYFKRSVARLRLGDLDGALEDAEAAIERLSSDDWIWTQRARVRIARGELRLAGADLVEGLRHFPRSPAVYEALAALARREGAARAAGLLSRASELSRGRSPPYLDCRAPAWAQPEPVSGTAAPLRARAEALLAAGDAEGACGAASEALGLQPADGDALKLRAQAFRALGRAADAADDERWATLLAPGEIR